MTYGEIFDEAAEIIGIENIYDYRPATFEAMPDTMCYFGQVCIPDTIMIWLKNGACIWYSARGDKWKEEQSDKREGDTVADDGEG